MTPGQIIRDLLDNPAPFSPDVLATPYDSDGIAWAPEAELSWPVGTTLPDVFTNLYIEPKES